MCDHSSHESVQKYRKRQIFLVPSLDPVIKVETRRTVEFIYTSSRGNGITGNGYPKKIRTPSALGGHV